MSRCLFFFSPERLNGSLVGQMEIKASMLNVTLTNATRQYLPLSFPPLRRHIFTCAPAGFHSEQNRAMPLKWTCDK